jgi:hypothetical protein
LITDAVIDRRHVMSATINAKLWRRRRRWRGRWGRSDGGNANSGIRLAHVIKLRASQAIAHWVTQIEFTASIVRDDAEASLY